MNSGRVGTRKLVILGCPKVLEIYSGSAYLTIKSIDTTWLDFEVEYPKFSADKHQKWGFERRPAPYQIGHRQSEDLRDQKISAGFFVSAVAVQYWLSVPEYLTRRGDGDVDGASD